MPVTPDDAGGQSEAAVRIGVVTVSNRAFRGIHTGQGGPGIEADPATCVVFRPKGA